jgi:diacylglycerol kinase family enzyme
MGEGAALDSGDLSGVILKRSSPLDIPTIAWRALSSHARVADHRQVHGFSEQSQLRVSSLDDRPLPVQVDGDYIGTTEEIEFSVVPGALNVLA